MVIGLPPRQRPPMAVVAFVVATLRAQSTTLMYAPTVQAVEVIIDTKNQSTRVSNPLESPSEQSRSVLNPPDHTKKGCLFCYCCDLSHLIWLWVRERILAGRLLPLPYSWQWWSTWSRSQHICQHRLAQDAARYGEIGSCRYYYTGPGLPFTSPRHF